MTRLAPLRLCALSSLLVATTVQAGSGPVKIAVPDFTLYGIDRTLGEAYAEHFVTLMGRNANLKLSTSRDIAIVLGVERQKQLLGCEEGQSSCLAELAGALGVDAVMSVSLVKAESGCTATVRVRNASDGSEVAAATSRLPSEAAMQEWLEAQAPELADRVLSAFGRSAVSASGAGAVLRWVPGVVGVLAVGAGVVTLVVAEGQATALRTRSFASREEIGSTASLGRTLDTVGPVLLGAGGAAIVGSLLWVLLAPRSAAHVALFPTSTGAGFAVGGTFQ